MAENLGTGVSYVDEPNGYNYDTVIFQKGKPPLDTEVNLLQQIQNQLGQRRLSSLPSGWLSFRPYYTSSLLKNSFYTQDPSNAVPEYALVNGQVVYVTGTNTSTANANLVKLPTAPISAAQVNGVFLEVWRALLGPNDPTNRPGPITIIDTILDIDAVNTNVAWAVGENGLVLYTENAGETWDVQTIATKNQLNSVYFVTPSIGWVVGNNGTMARTSTGGQNWTVQASGYIDNFNGIFMYSSLIGWIVGDSGIILKTTNGINWTAQYSGVSYNLRSIYFLDTQNGWAVGDSGVILRTSDGGTHWAVQTSGITSKLNSVYFYDINIGFAVGANGVILATSTSGATWYSQSNRINGNNSLSVEYTDVTMAPTLDDYVAGEDVSSQANGINKTFNVLNKPITKGDGTGTITNLPADVIVKVNGTAVLVDSLLGASGQIVLNAAPASCAKVIAYYWYKIDDNIVRGKAWITGKKGTIPTTIPLDGRVNNEDMSSQADGINKVFNVQNKPITKGNGTGTTTTATSDVVVKVNGSTAAVSSVDGANGQITLALAPSAFAQVRISYYYKLNYPVLKGGYDSGIVLESNDLGGTWTLQDPQTAYDINAIHMADKAKGWIAGQFSQIWHTINSGALWLVQNPYVVNRQVQRVYNEGNVDTTVYLLDDEIHPTTNIETTKRVQVQYKIRVVPDVDPFNYPEAGLGSQIVLSQGPNTLGPHSAFTNMGPTTGDYGMWRAECGGTVDGYSYAIPMAFIGRRNSSDFDPLNNGNGSTNNANSRSIRPDLLTSDNVVDADMLDVRHQILVPSAEQLLEENMDRLLDNKLETRFARNTLGTDRYGTQILQLDRIGGTDNDGGQKIGDSLSDAVTGKISSDVQIVTIYSDPNPWPATTVIPDPIILDPLKKYNYTGFFTQTPARSSATYVSSTLANNGKIVPGDFTGYGTSMLTFNFKNFANTITQDPGLGYNGGYDIKATFIRTDSTSLTYLPSDPKIVKNYSDTGALLYHGIFENEVSGKIVEQWDSGLSGYNNYVLAYPGSDSSSTTATMASTVELHYFVRADSSNVSGSNKILSIPLSKLGPDSTSIYSIAAVSKINNISAGLSLRLADILTQTGIIQIVIVPGYEYIIGSVYEMVAFVIANSNNKNIRNGATVNFIQGEKSLKTFCLSDILTINASTGISGAITVDSNRGSLHLGGCNIIGISSTMRLPSIPKEEGLILPFCWLNIASTGNKMYPIQIQSLGTILKFVIYDQGIPFTTTSPVVITIQALLKQNSFLFSGTSDGLMIGYYYQPYQCISDLPNSLTCKMLTKTSKINISNFGTGGSLLSKEPYIQPLINIPINNSNFINDNQFYNIEPLKFSNFSIDGGFVQIPYYVSADLNGEFIFSNSSSDTLGRFFYKTCSKDLIFRTEALQEPNSRKIFYAIIAEVLNSSDIRFLNSERILIIFSRSDSLGIDNYTGYINGDKNVVAVYRLPNKPLYRD